MSLTLGLNTALSGLLTSQRGLDVIAQNVTNVNTVGYTRKVMNQESRVVAGTGAGVQDGGVTRMVNEGLLKDIRRQTSNLAKLKAEQTYYPRIDDMFGEVGDNSSISHKLTSLNAAFEQLASNSSQPAQQWSTIQTAQDVTNSLQSMTKQLQDLRLQADQEIERTVGLINQTLDDIYDLNQKIVKNAAIATGTTDLEDKRDVAISELAKYIDIQYFKRGDNSVNVFTRSGEMLLDNQPQHLTYTASTVAASWMTAAGGEFGTITTVGSGIDLTGDITSGEIRAYISMRDEVIPRAQATVDELSKRLMETVNQVHNRGTSLPNIASSYTGTRTFASQGDIVPDASDAVATLYKSGGTVAHGGLAIAAGSGAYPWQATITATNAIFTSPAYDAGATFTLSGADTAANSGTYRVLTRVDNNNVIVEKVNPRQTIQLSGTDDVVLGLFDKSGNQLARTTLDTIMQIDYQASYGGTPGTGRNIADFDNKTSRGDWSINEVSAHVESWLKSQGYTNASVNLNSDGKMVMNVGDSTVSLAIRDQGSSTDGSEQTDATIAFDVNGDGATDETVKGFSNFFGLNDFFTKAGDNSIFDSEIQAATFRTNTARTLSMYDTTGQIGPSFTVATNSSLDDIATAIDRYGRTTESTGLTTTSWTTTTASVVTVADPSGTLFSTTVAAGTVTLEQLAGVLTQGSVTASVIVDAGVKRLRLTDSRGEELTVSFNGGDISGGSDLSQTLDMVKKQTIYASVVPDGSGQRLRIIQSDNKEMFLSSPLDGQGRNLLSDLGLERAATNTAQGIAVNSTLINAPEKISRGAMQWNSDINEYYLSEGDNATALDLSAAVTSKVSFDSAGGLYAGKHTFSEYASAAISVVAGESSHSKDTMDYQKTLNESLDFQYTSFSGVNLDEEVSSMVDFQQAYTAAARVISVIQEMLKTLTDIM